jgi:hypothetical protein
MSLLWALIVRWLVAFGGWVWTNLAPGAALNRLTFKRTLYLAVLLFVIIALVRVGSSDFAFMWAGDAALYFEVASVAIFFTVRGPARQIRYMAGRQIREALQKVGAFVRRHKGALRGQRKKGAESPKQSDDEPGAWDGWPVSYARAAFSN